MSHVYNLEQIIADILVNFHTDSISEILICIGFVKYEKIQSPFIIPSLAHERQRFSTKPNDDNTSNDISTGREVRLIPEQKKRLTRNSTSAPHVIYRDREAKFPWGVNAVRAHHDNKTDADDSVARALSSRRMRQLQSNEFIICPPKDTSFFDQSDEFIRTAFDFGELWQKITSFIFPGYPERRVVDTAGTVAGFNSTIPYGFVPRIPPLPDPIHRNFPE